MATLPSGLDVLPGRSATGVSESTGREAQAVVLVARGNLQVLNGGKDLVAVVGGRAGQETVTLEGPVSGIALGLVGEFTDDGALGHGGGVGLGEAHGTGGIDVDLLAAGDFDVQGVATGSDDGLVAGRAGLDSLTGAVGGGGATEVELLAGSVQGGILDAGAGADGDHAKRWVGGRGLAGGRSGGQQREGEGSNEGLHVESTG